MWTSSPIRFVFAQKLRTSTIHRRCIGTHWNRSLTVVSCRTGDYVAGRWAGYGNQVKLSITIQPTKAVPALNVNTIQSIMLRSIFFNYGPVHICENSNKLGRVNSQSKVENKMVPYWTAATIFTTILHLEARRKVKEASKASKKLNTPSETVTTDETVFGQASTYLCFGHSLAYFVLYEQSRS